MKSLIFAAFAALSMAAPAMAQGSTDLNAALLRMCGAKSKAAESIMMIRQSGLMSMTEVIEVFADSETQRNLATPLIVEAYETPLFSTEKNKVEAAKEFSSATFADCLGD